MFLDVGRLSPVGNPFADSCQQHDKVLRAYEEWLILAIWYGLTQMKGGSATTLDHIARRYGVHLHHTSGTYEWRVAWEWLHRAASYEGVIVLMGECGVNRGAPSQLQHTSADVAAGAISWLRDLTHSRDKVVALPQLKAGCWPIADIFARWPKHIASELAAISWPITAISELQSLLRCKHAAPKAIVAFEFSAAVRGAYERHWKFERVALSVDLRSSLVVGPHACMDVRDIIGCQVWQDAYFHPPCTHQVLSDTRTLHAKHLDGRTFWGIALFIYCWCVKAHRILIEQPATVIPNLYLHPTQQLRPCDVGDEDNKPIHLYERGGRLLLHKNPAAEGVSGHKRIRDFENSDARDRWRSSWARFPKLAEAVVAAVDEDSVHAEHLDYGVEIERFARSWYEAGYPLPADYASPDAQPASQADMDYQSQRGRGDGRRCAGVVPVSKRDQTGLAPLFHSGKHHHLIAATPDAPCALRMRCTVYSVEEG